MAAATIDTRIIAGQSGEGAVLCVCHDQKLATQKHLEAKDSQRGIELVFVKSRYEDALPSSDRVCNRGQLT